MSKQKKKGLVPERRFPEFRDSRGWEEKKLNDIAVFFKGKGISKADIDPQGETPCIRYGELYTLYGEVISTVFSRTKLRTAELFLSQKNDVLIPSSGETKLDIAKASCVLLDDVALGSDLNVLRPSENGIFLSYMLNGVCKREIAKKAQGDAVVHLYSSQLKLLDVIVPKEPEQQKIADCLTSVDELITAKTQKLDALKTYKKGLLQQLFPAKGETLPKHRFPEFRDKGEWKIKPFNKLFTIGNGRDYKHLSSGNIPVYGSGGYMLSVNEYLYDGESVCIGRKGTINNPIFQNINWLEHNEAGGVPSLSKANITKIEIAIPKPKEQKKIADCLTSIDELITAQAQKIDALKAHKKGLMQQLFPVMNEVGA